VWLNGRAPCTGGHHPFSAFSSSLILASTRRRAVPPTMDLVPEVKIIVHRDGESAEPAAEEEKADKKKKAKEETAAEEAPAATAE